MHHARTYTYMFAILVLDDAGDEEEEPEGGTGHKDHIHLVGRQHLALAQGGRRLTVLLALSASIHVNRQSAKVFPPSSPFFLLRPLRVQP